MGKIAVGLMAKFPEMGKVKTRLAAEIGDPAALQIYATLLQIVMEKLRELNRDRFQTSVFVAQEKLVERFRSQYPGAAHYAAQSAGDLGARMEAAMRNLLTGDSIEGVLLIGADIPGITAEIVEEAASQLLAHDLVLGPTFDGGYYLIGSRTVHPELFRQMEWSTDSVLSETLKRAGDAGLTIFRLEELSDLDTLEDVGRLPRESNALINLLDTYSS